MTIKTPPRLSLSHSPTPLVRLERIGRNLPTPLWMKRDDLTGLELSGNKIRKLEYIFAAALADGCDTLVTEGTPQSNHCRATAAVAAQLGLRCVLLIRPEPVGSATGNLWLNQLFGAEILAFARPHFDDHRGELVERALSELRTDGRSPRWIPMGASEPLGCWGYIRCAGELAAQLPAAGIDECDLVVPVSSAGTYAGLLLGAQLQALNARVHGVLVSDDLASQREAVTKLCVAAIEQFALPVEWRAERMQLWDGFIGPGYGKFYPQVHDTIRALARAEGIVLDPVYTAKAFYGMLELIRAGSIGRDRPVVFIHTGGIFSAFAWAEEIGSTGT